MAGLQVIGSIKAKPYTPPSQQEPEYEFSHESSAVRVVAVIGGVHYLVPTVRVTLNAHTAADSAEITLPVKGSPDFTVEFAGAYIVGVKIYLGIYQNAPTEQDLSISGKTLIFSGQVDMYSVAFHDDSVSFKCRSLAAQLIDNRVTGLPRNMTTVGFVNAIAKQYNLTPVIMLPEGAYHPTVAEVYAHDFAVGVQNLRIIDMLQNMAEFDDADVYVIGSNLYYASPSLIPRKTIDVKYGRDIAVDGGLSFDHSILPSGKIRVEVRTYNPKTRFSTITRAEDAGDGTVDITTSSKLVTSTPEFGTANTTTTSISSTGAQTTTQSTVLGSGAKTITSSDGSAYNANGPQIYKYYKPNLSPEAANNFALAQRRRISMQQYSVTTTIPLKRSIYQDLSITALIRLHGVPMQKVNDTYWPRQIEIDVDIDGGALATIQMVNTTLPAGQV